MNSEQYYIDLKDPTKQDKIAAFHKVYQEPLSCMQGMGAYYFIGEQYSLWEIENQLNEMKYPTEFEDYYADLPKPGYTKIIGQPSFYKDLCYKNWLQDKQTKEEFESWWTANYKNKLGSNIIELSFKEVAQAAWYKQQSTIDELAEQVNSLHNDLTQLD